MQQLNSSGIKEPPSVLYNCTDGSARADAIRRKLLNWPSFVSSRGMRLPQRIHLHYVSGSYTAEKALNRLYSNPYNHSSGNLKSKHQLYITVDMDETIVQHICHFLEI